MHRDMLVFIGKNAYNGHVNRRLGFIFYCAKVYIGLEQHAPGRGPVQSPGPGMGSNLIRDRSRTIPVDRIIEREEKWNTILL
jgi:hypothetical protein